MLMVFSPLFTLYMRRKCFTRHSLQKFPAKLKMSNSCQSFLMIQASHLNNQHRSGIKKLIHSHARHSREINRSKYLPAESQKAKATTFLSLSRSVCISRPSAFKVSPVCFAIMRFFDIAAVNICKSTILLFCNICNGCQ